MLSNSITFFDHSKYLISLFFFLRFHISIDNMVVPGFIPVPVPLVNLIRLQFEWFRQFVYLFLIPNWIGDIFLLEDYCLLRTLERLILYWLLSPLCIFYQGLNHCLFVWVIQVFVFQYTVEFGNEIAFEGFNLLAIKPCLEILFP